MSIRSIIFDALNKANADGENPIEAPASVIATELRAEYKELRRMSRGQIVPYIQEWKTKHDHP